MMERQRLTALKTRIEPIINGKYVKREGFDPNYVVANGIHYSRIRVMGTVVDVFKSNTKSFSSITIDDGSGTIRAKAFNSNILDNFERGDIIDAVGKLKEYQEEIFMIPEVIKKVEPNWLILRELEIREEEGTLNKKRKIVEEIKKEASDLEEVKQIAKERGLKEEEVEAISQEDEKDNIEGQNDESRQKVIKLIEENDKGDGCDYTILIEQSGLGEEELDTVISNILEEGMCFEPRPGKIKKL